VLGASSPSPFVGGNGGTKFTTEPCPDGTIAVGANLRAGDSVDAFGLICAPMRVR